jgi:asparagine synthase (glutamine-hydrolysing)
MSGICGIIHFNRSPVDPALLRRLSEAARHRGPDGVTERLVGDVGFAHLALYSTPEAVHERQPLASRDGRLLLVADARIDNRQELLEELRSTGHLQDGSWTDADLILAAYQRWAAACAGRLIGDFAFAIWDVTQRRLFCARDGLGIKSLCYARAGDVFIFGSEVGQVLAHPRIRREIDRTMIGVRVVGCTEDPARTLFKGIHRVPPASVLVVDETGGRHDRYWEPPIEDSSSFRSGTDWADELRLLLTRAVRDRLRSSTPTVAVQMSGGLDSCAVASTASRIGSKSVVAVTYRFATLESCDETPYSRMVAAAGGFSVRYVDAESRWFLHDLDAYRPSADSPLLGWPTITTEVCLVTRREGARVLLTGRGGDELFRGDPAVLGEHLWCGRASPIDVFRQISRLAHERDVGPWRAFARWVLRPAAPASMVRWVRNTMGSPQFPTWSLPHPELRHDVRDHLSAASAPLRSRRMTQQVRYERLRDLGAIHDVFRYYDRLGSRFGVEVRHPLLDRRLAEFALRLPTDCLFREGMSKWLLRHALRNILPEEVRCRRRKTSFAPFMDLALKSKERKRVSELFRHSRLGGLGLVDPSALAAAYNSYCDRSAQALPVGILQCIGLEMWLRAHGGVN